MSIRAILISAVAAVLLVALVTTLAITSPLLFNILVITVLTIFGLVTWWIAVVMTLDQWRKERATWRR